MLNINSSTVVFLSCISQTYKPYQGEKKFLSLTGKYCENFLQVSLEQALAVSFPLQCQSNQQSKVLDCHNPSHTT